MHSLMPTTGGRALSMLLDTSKVSRSVRNRSSAEIKTTCTGIKTCISAYLRIGSCVHLVMHCVLLILIILLGRSILYVTYLYAYTIIYIM